MFLIKAADLVIGIENQFDNVRELCRTYITDGLTSPDFSVSVSENELRTEAEKTPEYFFSDEQAESVILCEKISNALPRFDAFMMHSAAIEVNGKAYCFAAASGTGKSTHIRHWKRVLGERMTVINGDKPICRFRGSQLFVYGTPWCGKENWQKNTSAPLEAVCLLERGQENAVYLLNPSTVMDELLRNFHILGRDQVDIMKLLELIDRMVTTVPVYRLRCTDDVSAAETAIAYFGIKKE